MQINASDLQRWETAGCRLFDVTPTVLHEITDLRVDPSKSRLIRAASAARYAALIADQPLKTEAVALAEELERRSCAD
jgi:hypothetical protein